jgi:hypothetical protein
LIKNNWDKLCEKGGQYKPDEKNPDFLAWIVESFFTGIDLCNEAFFNALDERLKSVHLGRALSYDESRIVTPSLKNALHLARINQLSAATETSTSKKSAAPANPLSEKIINENEHKELSDILLNLRNAFFAKLRDWSLDDEVPNDEKKLAKLIVQKGRLYSQIPDTRRSNQDLLLLSSLHIKNKTAVQSEEDELFSKALEYFIMVFKADNIANLVKQYSKELCQKCVQYQSKPNDPDFQAWLTKTFFADIDLCDNEFFVVLKNALLGCSLR